MIANWEHNYLIAFLSEEDKGFIHGCQLWTIRQKAVYWYLPAVFKFSSVTCDQYVRNKYIKFGVFWWWFFCYICFSNLKLPYKWRAENTKVFQRAQELPVVLTVPTEAMPFFVMIWLYSSDICLTTHHISSLYLSILCNDLKLQKDKVIFYKITTI